jgi:hypothetical protein
MNESFVVVMQIHSQIMSSQKFDAQMDDIDNEYNLHAMMYSIQNSRQHDNLKDGSVCESCMSGDCFPQYEGMNILEYRFEYRLAHRSHNDVREFLQEKLVIVITAIEKRLLPS